MISMVNLFPQPAKVLIFAKLNGKPFSPDCPTLASVFNRWRRIHRVSSKAIRRPLTWLVLLVWLALGCSRADSPNEFANPPPGFSGEIEIAAPDGRQRTYQLVVPENLANTNSPVPLVIALHGGLGWGTQFEKSSGFDAIAEANSFIIAYPNGNPVSNVGNSAVWNAGGCCGRVAGDDVAYDDVGFLNAVIDDVSANYEIDPDRIFATGHSNGAMMAYRLACESADSIAAIAVQSGPLYVEPCEPSQPVSVLHIHGTADDNVPIEGGVGSRSIAGNDFPSALTGLELMVAAASCDATPEPTQDRANQDVSYLTWTDCAADSIVKFMIVDTADHGWMGGDSQTGRSTPYQLVDSSIVIWDFLESNGR